MVSRDCSSGLATPRRISPAAGRLCRSGRSARFRQIDQVIFREAQPASAYLEPYAPRSTNSSAVLVRLALASRMPASAINVRHIFNCRARRAAVFAVRIGGTATVRMSAFLCCVGRHFVCLPFITISFAEKNLFDAPSCRLMPPEPSRSRPVPSPNQSAKLLSPTNIIRIEVR